MVTDYTVRQSIKALAMIIQKTINPLYTPPSSPSAFNALRNALDRLEEHCMGFSPKRIADYLVSCVYAFREKPERMSFPHMFGPASSKRFDTSKGARYYEDRWLSNAGLSRSVLEDLIQSRDKHPKERFIYLEYEEPTKKRLLNSEEGYWVCQESTLGWSPFSECCRQCFSKARCERETAEKYPEIYRLRKERYGTTQQGSPGPV